MPSPPRGTSSIPVAIARVAAAACVLALLAVAPPVAPQAAPAERAEPDYGHVALSFEANRGQTDRRVDFLSRGAGHTLFLTPTEAVLDLRRLHDGGADDARAVVRLRVLGGNKQAAPEALAPLPGRVNYFVGDRENWHVGIPTFAKVAYRGVYPGIDLVYHGTQGKLEYDFVVSPNVDPTRIELAVEGADDLWLDPYGRLVIRTPAGDVTQGRPVVYQDVAGQRRLVEGSFVLTAPGTVGFDLGEYDRSVPLVIDPTLEYSTFLGGTANDFGFGIAVDEAGNAYLGGQTGSAVFPRGGAGDPAPVGATPGALQTVKSGGTDAFALKLNPAGDTVLWATYLGGHRNDAAWDLALGDDGAVYLAGSTASGNDIPSTVAVEAPFPTTASAFDQACGGDGFCDHTTIPRPDFFLAKLGAMGDQLLYSSYLGGAGEEQSGDEIPYSGFGAVAVRDQRAYVTSMTFSPDFPVTGNAAQRTCGSCGNGLSDAFLSVLDTSGAGASSLVYSTYLGGRATDEGKGVAVDEAGRAYVTGHTFGNAETRQGNPTRNDFPVKRAFQTRYQGGYSDAYVAKVDPFAARARKTLVYSTFVGGGGLEEGWDVALAPGGTEAYLTGYTTSGPNPSPPIEDPAHPGACAAEPDPDTGVRPFCDYASDPAPYFPTTTGPAYAGRGSTDSGGNLFLNGDAFVLKLDAAGDGLVWSRFLGGPNADYGQGLAVDSSGRAYVVGWTTCRSQDPPLEPGDPLFNVALDEPPPPFYVDDPTVPDNDGVDLDNDGVADPGDTDVDGDGVPDAPEIAEGTPTGRNAGEPSQTGVPDCPSPTNGFDLDGGFPQVDPINQSSPAGPGGSPIDETVMDSTNFGNHLHNSPTAMFLSRVTADGTALEYSLLLDGFGFDRGFDVAVRDTDGDAPLPAPEAFVTGRVGSCGAPRPCADGSPFPTTLGALDTTYNGAGRDTTITKVVG